MGGGLFAANTTALLGPTGCGKTTIALRFVAHGALEDESCLYLSFQETPEQLWPKPRVRLGPDRRPRLRATPDPHILPEESTSTHSPRWCDRTRRTHPCNASSSTASPSSSSPPGDPAAARRLPSPHLARQRRRRLPDDHQRDAGPRPHARAARWPLVPVSERDHAPLRRDRLGAAPRPEHPQDARQRPRQGPDPVRHRRRRPAS